MRSDSDSKTRLTGLEVFKARRPGEDCLVVIHSPVQSELGQRHLLREKRMTIGRGEDNDIVLASDTVSRSHCQLEQRGDTIVLVDLGSTNGTFVNDGPRLAEQRCLRRGDRLRIGSTILKYLAGTDVEVQYHEVVFRMRITDGLTNLHNRTQLDALLEEEIARARRHGRELSLLMLDIDHFKNINDTHGHLAGDAVLRGVAALLQKRLRPSDSLGRYGGEEFCAILPETSLEKATVFAEGLRALVETTPFQTESQEVTVTVSIGAGSFREGMQPSDLYRSADDRLYQAKRSGRNRVC